MGMLGEANPSSLDEFFAKDPLQLTDQDLEVIVAELRRMREKFLSAGGPAAEKSSTKKVTPKSLSDIGL